MNAALLVTEVLKIVDSAGFAAADALKYLNRAQLAVANRLLLPDLADGYDTVTTSTSAYSVALPSDYHKGLFLAQVDDEQVNTFKDILSLSKVYGKLTTTAGSIVAVAINAGNLVYQEVPATAADIELFYYRKPVDMTNVDTSFPDGLQDVDAYDDALIYYACWKMYTQVEQGLEGAKIDTKYNEDRWEQMVDRVGLHCAREGVAIADTPANKLW